MAQLAVVLVLKRLRRQGKWLEVSSDRLGELGIIVCGRVPWLYQYWPGGFMLFVVLCPGTPEGSTGSGSGFKASQKTGQRLKVSSAGNRTWELGIDDTFKRFRILMHVLTIKYLKIYKYHDVILISEKEKNTSLLLKFLLFIICEYNLIRYFINTSAFMTA